jgi:FkbM family methyltransferase
MSLFDRSLREARAALLRSPVGRWRDRRILLSQARAWTPADEKLQAFYAQFVEPGDIAFDVGANAGNRTKVFLRLGARVVAVEPQSSCASLLDEAFGREPGFSLIRQALGAEPGVAELKLSEATTIASMSPAWVKAVRSSGRFAAYHWGRSERVPVTTLDALIQRHGEPAFVKIDVEGFELEVLKGLSRPVRALSFEFTPECADAALACVAHLESLGFTGFNYSPDESMRLEAEPWGDVSFIRTRLEGLRGDVSTFGDVYARS